MIVILNMNVWRKISYLSTEEDSKTNWKIYEEIENPKLHFDLARVQNKNCKSFLFINKVSMKVFGRGKHFGKARRVGYKRRVLLTSVFNALVKDLKNRNN